MTENATTVSTRALSPRQVQTRDRIRDAAVGLAADDGDALSMRDVAREAGVSPATAYTYYGSVEHLLAEVYLDWVLLLTDRLRERPPTGATAFDRVLSVIRRATEGAGEQPALARAFTRAMASSDPSVARIRPALESAFRDWIDLAIGDTVVPDRDTVVDTLELALYGGMISVLHERRTITELRRVLTDAARLLLGGEAT